MMKPTRRLVGRAILAKLKKVVYDTPEARLCFAIWGHCITTAYQTLPSQDADRVARMRNALEQALSDFALLELSGVEPSYALRVIDEYDSHLPADQVL